MINFSDIKNIDPVKNGIIAINRNYEKLASILPNMSPKILTGDDLLPVLVNKLEEKDINDKNYIFYRIDTTTQTNY